MSQLLERRRDEARLIPLVAHHDQPAADDLLIAPVRGGVQAPLEHVARNEPRTWDHAVALALGLGADVDQHCTRARRCVRLLGGYATQTRARLGQQLLDARHPPRAGSRSGSTSQAHSDRFQSGIGGS